MPDDLVTVSKSVRESQTAKSGSRKLQL